MSPLPSFIELMESLGLEQNESSPELSPSPSPTLSPSSPHLGGTTAPSPSRSRSSPSLRDLSSRHRAPRYSPYSSYTRRGSTSSSSSSDLEYTKRSSTSPPPSSLRARRSRNQLTVNVYGSTSDLPAYTPISSYVRRKTPGASPTSPTFPRLVTYESVDITLPIVPSFPNSASTDSSFPRTPQSATGASSSSPRLSDKALIVTETTEIRSPIGHRRWHTGVRISTPPFSAGLDDTNRRRLIPHFA
ncbi:hypothetical protein P691DRAFT_785406 [Macrolepiota fuliginosa MF-IS2]|uniref:Uncharacterized protein n=1 Tax=Macrolepiota fuliginosa MF-IS2 TaxID=1400762 RepID=A0A9P5XM25_9AGAR|nr:hypothetical protein P691DRAFT_785406 [Macrolepiota fuliginosa MF-IS2]